MGKLGYIVGFSVLGLLLLTVVGSASVIGLRGGENQADPGSVGDRPGFNRVVEGQGTIAEIAEDIAQRTQGKTDLDDPGVKYYLGLLQKHNRGSNCTSCSSFTYVVVKESGLDPGFPGGSAEDQISSLLKNGDSYYIFSVDPNNKDACNNRPLETPKRGDLLYRRKTKNYGHTGVYIRDNNGSHIVASASLNERSPKQKPYSNLAEIFDCGVRLTGLPQASKAISTE
ncbi:C40 family peptidase [Candidatus Berkelbacteria bacterium]|nr:C40 family peptidase [Candidatus Berkelbacteria bacterium]